MMQEIFDFFSGAGQEVGLFLVSLIPFIELRGAVLIGAGLGMPWQETFLISVLGNLLPVPFLILLTRPIFKWLKNTKLFAGFTHKLEGKLMKKADKVMRYSAVGLFLFVAVPLPGTGAWSGSLIAALLNMRLSYALPAIAAGVVAAGFIMTFVSYGFFSIVSFF